MTRTGAAQGVSTDARRGAFAEPPHTSDPTGALVGWFTDPPGVVVKFTAPTFATLAHVQWFVGPGKRALLARFPIEQLTIVVDLSQMTGRDPAVRPLMIEAAKEMRTHTKRLAVIPPRDASPVYYGTLKAMTAVLAAMGVHIVMHSSLANALAQLQLTVGLSTRPKP